MGVFQGEFCASFKEKIWIYMQLYAKVHIIAYKMPGWGIKWHKVPHVSQSFSGRSKVIFSFLQVQK